MQFSEKEYKTYWLPEFSFDLFKSLCITAGIMSIDAILSPSFNLMEIRPLVFLP